MYTAAAFITTLGLSYAAVPFYRAFCAATGFSGTPVSSSHTSATGRFEAERLTAVPHGKRIKVNFNAETSTSLPWKFTPQQKFVTVVPGETSLAFYTAKNTSDKDIIGIATYNVTPAKIAPYFAKIECFCFEEQKLLAGEEVDMPIFFFVDKDFMDDPTMRDIDDVVLSYTFFKARRNEQGHLEPDADQATVNESMGWSEYEHAEKKTSKPT